MPGRTENRYRRYNLCFLVAYIILLLVIPITSLWLEPLSGDLTRIGGFRENDFGWQRPQHTLTRAFAMSGDYQASYDIVVVGDSFSVPGNRWDDFLAAHSGLRIGVFPNTGFDLQYFLASPAYRRAPPRLFVYESIERELRYHLASPSNSCVPSARPVLAPPLTSRSSAVKTVQVSRPTPRLSMDQAGYALQYLLRPMTVAAWSTQVLKLPLARDDLFSDRASSQLLIVADDTLKSQWKNSDWINSVCVLIAMQNQVQRSGRTSFVALLPPDKLTAYTPYLRNPEYRGISKLSQMLDANPVATVRVDRMVAALIAQGAKDVYQPNDTHWSPATQLMASDLIYRYMLDNGILRDDSDH